MKLPKQFCDLFGEPLQTMTLRRLSPLGNPWVVTSAVLKDLTEVNAGASGLKMGQLIYEPQGKNTAAAVGLVCRVLEMRGLGDEIVGIFPADHLVTKEADFLAALRFAEELARDGKVVTLGIRPGHPETGFGYIQTEKAAFREKGDLSAYPVTRFHEKPSLEKAKEFMADGSHHWNAGIFVFRASVMKGLLKTHEPAVWNPLEDLKEDLSNLDEVYAAVKSISIDYAVMEKIGGTGLLACLPVDIGWSDVGSWDAVAEEAAARGGLAPDQVHLIDSSDVYVRAPEGKIVAVIGAEGLQVIDTGDVLLISKKGESQKVRRVVESLSGSGDPLLIEPSLSEHPWGSVQVLKRGAEFCSRLITVRPRSRTSEWESGDFQWTILSGSGELVCGEDRKDLRAGAHLRSSSAPKRMFRNTGEESLVILEVRVESPAHQ